MQDLVQMITKYGSDGAVMFKLNAEGRVETISPLVKATDLETMLNQLGDVRNAIDAFIKEVVDKNLPKN